MTGALPAAIRRPLVRPWPPLARALGGAVGGLGVAAIVDAPGPAWRPLLAAAVLAIVAVAAPITVRLETWGGAPGLAFATTLGLYVGVPETDRVLGASVALVPFVVATLLGGIRSGGGVVVALGAVLMWLTFGGAGDRPPALVAGTAALGLLVVSPVVAALPGPPRSLLPRVLVGGAVAATNTLAVVAIGRRGAVSDSWREVAVLAALGLAALAVITRLLHGPVPARSS